MVRGGQPQPHIEQWQGDRVSNAFCPVHIRRGISTSKAAQCRRGWMMLADALSMRKLLVLTTLLVVGTSLLVAVFGLHFWYLLLLPLPLFTMLLHNRATLGIVPPPPLAQSQRSSAGYFSREAPELRVKPALRPEDAPMTSTLADASLVRVLETYTVRTTANKHLLTHFPEDTAEQAMLRALVQDFWSHATSAVWQGQNLPCSQEGSDASALDGVSSQQMCTDSE